MPSENQIQEASAISKSSLAVPKNYSTIFIFDPKLNNLYAPGCSPSMPGTLEPNQPPLYMTTPRISTTPTMISTRIKMITIHSKLVLCSLFWWSRSMSSMECSTSKRAFNTCTRSSISRYSHTASYSDCRESGAFQKNSGVSSTFPRRFTAHFSRNTRPISFEISFRLMVMLPVSASILGSSTASSVCVDIRSSKMLSLVDWPSA
mmetsp:Transcript_13298/g.25494  ORF Transcript_13298/g.25494 Transcript_13298/m.25494 type:complete len:205 (-) Transcript_13298:889-1503(-)